MVTSAMTFHGHFSSPYDFSVLRLVSVHPFTHPLPATRTKTPPNTHLLPTVQLTPFHYYHPNHLALSIPILPQRDVHPPSLKHHYDPLTYYDPTTSHLHSTTITPLPYPSYSYSPANRCPPTVT